jgi:hypothetical protein
MISIHLPEQRIRLALYKGLIAVPIQSQMPEAF